MSIVNIPFIQYPPRLMQNITYHGAVMLDAAEEFLAIVLQVPQTGTLKKIGWYVGSVSGSSYTVKVSVETVAETVGQPVATTNAGKTLYTTGAESDDITSLSSNSVNFVAINGTSGISVTSGDLIAITIRMIATSGSAISIVRGVSNVNLSSGVNAPYSAAYVNSAWSIISNAPAISMEYSDGIIMADNCHLICTNVSASYNSSSNPDRRGLKFRYPYKCRLSGLVLFGDIDYNANIVMYDSDEYTVMSGFPIAINASKRRTTDFGTYNITFPTKPVVEANTWYRIVLLPTTTSNVSLVVNNPSDDGTILAINAFPEKTDAIYTTRTGAPSSDNHVWDDYNYKPCVVLIIDGIDTGSGGGSGISRSRQVMG